MIAPVSLVGMILTMVQLIAKAAETARQNKKKCWELAQRACTLAHVLPDYKYPAANDQEPETVMRRLKETLDEALTLIQSCQTATVFSRSRKAAELDGVIRMIGACITDLNFIGQVRTYHIGPSTFSPLPAQTYDSGLQQRLCWLPPTASARTCQCSLDSGSVSLPCLSSPLGLGL